MPTESSDCSLNSETWFFFHPKSWTPPKKNDIISKTPFHDGSWFFTTWHEPDLNPFSENKLPHQFRKICRNTLCIKTVLSPDLNLKIFYTVFAPTTKISHEPTVDTWTKKPSTKVFRQDWYNEIKIDFHPTYFMRGQKILLIWLSTWQNQWLIMKYEYWTHVGHGRGHNAHSDTKLLRILT